MAAINVGDRISLFAKNRDVRLGIGDVVRIFKNAVEVDLVESRMMIGPFGKKRFFLHETRVVK